MDFYVPETIYVPKTIVFVTQTQTLKFSPFSQLYKLKNVVLRPFRALLFWVDKITHAF